MDIQERLEEIHTMETLLGKYHGVLKILYQDKKIHPDYYKHQLEYIRDCLIQVKGLDCPDINQIQAEIKELSK